MAILGAVVGGGDVVVVVVNGAGSPVSRYTGLAALSVMFTISSLVMTEVMLCTPRDPSVYTLCKAQV